MVLNLYSIFDKKAAAYIPPFFMHNDQVALRACANCVADPTHQWHMNPGDYDLYRLGIFDDASGEIVPDMQFIVSLTTFVEVKQ